MMEDYAELAAQQARDRERRLARQPTGEAERVDAPDLNITFEGVGTTDKKLADEFIAQYRHLFVNGNGQLYVYIERLGRWVSDKVEEHVYVLVMHMSNRYHQQRVDVIRDLEVAAREQRNEEAERLARQRAALDKLIQYCEKANTIGNVARLVARKLSTVLLSAPVHMNHDPEVLACRNGVVDLRTGQLRWPRMGDLLTLTTGIDYTAGSTQWWEEKVLQIAGSDPALAEFIQVWFGYCSTAYTREHCMAVLWGNGRNGKNILLDAVAGSLGKYAMSLANSFLETQDRAEVGNNVLYMMAQLHGARFAYVSETGERGRLRESIVKSLTGDKTIRARLAHKDYFEFNVSHKFTIGTNHKPEISGTDDGVWERIRLVPMRVKFGTQDELDAGTAAHLKDVTLLTEIERDERKEEVLRWIVAGAVKYLTHGLNRYTPASITAETLVYRREQDVLGQFLQQVSAYVHPDEIKRTTARLDGLPAVTVGKMADSELLQVDKMVLWRCYAAWATDNGHGVMSSTQFFKRVTSAQRFWPGDGTGENMMPPLHAVRTNRGGRYRWFSWTEFGRGLSNYAEQQHQKATNREPAGEEPEF